MKQFSNRTYRTRRGAVLPLVALMLPVLLLMAGFAINIAYMQLSATELQVSTDAAAKAAGGTYTRTRDLKSALAAANAAGQLNSVAGDSLVFKKDDIILGASVRDPNSGKYTFEADNGSNAIKVLGRREPESANGKINTFLPNLMGVNGFAIRSESVSTRIDIDLVLVMDRSGSMAYAEDELAQYPPIPANAPDGWFFGDPLPKESRWESSFDAVDAFVKELNLSALDEQVSLVTYADSGTLDQELTEEYQLIIQSLDERFVNFDGGGTNIRQGVKKALVALKSDLARDFSAKVVVLMTDGQITSGGDPSSFVEEMAEDGIMTVTISFSNEADIALMQSLATLGKGFHIHANSSEELKDAFQEIVRRLPAILTQ